MIELLGTDDCLEAMREARNSHWVSYVRSCKGDELKYIYNLANYIYVAICM